MEIIQNLHIKFIPVCYINPVGKLSSPTRGASVSLLAFFTWAPMYTKISNNHIGGLR